MEINGETLAERMTDAARQAGLSAYQIAERMSAILGKKVWFPTVYAWLLQPNGDKKPSKPSTQNLTAFAEVVGVPAEDLRPKVDEERVYREVLDDFLEVIRSLQSGEDAAAVARQRGLKPVVVDLLEQQGNQIEQRLAEVYGADWRDASPAELQAILDRLGGAVLAHHKARAKP